MSANLTEESMRILWPPDQAPLSRSSATTNASSTRINLSAAEEFEIAIPPVTSGPFNSSYLRWKVTFGGTAKLKAPLFNNGEPLSNQLGIGGRVQTNGEAAIVAKFEREMCAGITTEMSLGLSSSNFTQISQKIATGDWVGAVKDLFDMKIKRSFNLSQSGASGIDIEIDIAADDHLCFFGVSCKPKIAFPLNGIRGLSLPHGYKVEFETPITFRFNLTEMAWSQIARRLGGGPILKSATEQIANIAARQAIRSALTASGIFAVSVAGSLGLLYLTAELCSSARAEGMRRGLLLGYCIGYLERIKQYHGAAPRIASRSSTARFIDGWNDAERAIRATSLNRVERTIIYHFASNYDYDGWGTISNLASGNFELAVEHAHSRVGEFIDEDHEVTGIALDMSFYLAREIESVVSYLRSVRAGGFIRSTNRRSQLR